MLLPLDTVLAGQTDSHTALSNTAYQTVHTNRSGKMSGKMSTKMVTGLLLVFLMTRCLVANSTKPNNTSNSNNTATSMVARGTLWASVPLSLALSSTALQHAGLL
ncbi:hypothetical protein MATL_G00040750 [Megalops atlanticus]|uniref:Uncharacterized protein n=1 Tax=Megalops atlanticus TaxID=7932 RepID=A0A9D3QA76_MEGAT|nr:hypothetical protein MATL_G00040750 [Megalops atlanticus]